MPTEIDNLQIKINADAQKANNAIDVLVGKLDVLTTSLGRIDGSKLTGLANSVNALGSAVKTAGSIDSRKFERLAINITKLSTLDTASINRAASSMNQLRNGLNSLSSVSQNAVQISEVASNISKLGGKNVTNAITNLPLLTTELNKFMSVIANSPQVSKNIIDMTNALANLSAQGRSVGAATNSLTNGLNKSDKAITRTSKSTLSLASAFGKFYATYFLAIRGIKGLWGSIEKTADYFEALNYFNVAFDKIAGEWSQDFEKYGYENAEAYANSFTDRMEDTFSKLSGVEFNEEKGLLSETGVKNLGLNIQQLTQYSSQLASVTNSLGLTGEASLATSQAFTKLAGDISSLFNIDYKQVSANFTSGLLGQSKALYKYGIDITQATLQTKAYELGLSKAVSEMTQGEKAQLRLLAILDQSRIAWGDQANTINSLANQVRILENGWSEVGMVFGQLFVPMLEEALPIINGMVIALKRLLINIAGFMGVEIDPNKFNTGLNDNEEILDGITDGFEDATAAAKEYENQILGFDEITKLQDTTATLGFNTDGSGIDLTQEILDATSEYERVWAEAYANMENRAEEWADKIGEYFSASSWFDKGQDVSSLATGIFDFFTDAIEEVDWNEVGDNIGEFLKGIDWYSVLTSGLELSFSISELIADVWFSSLETAPIETGLLTAFAVLNFTGAGNLIATKFKLAVVSAFMGYNLGEHIYELVTGEEVDYSWSDYLGKNFDLEEWVQATNMSLDEWQTNWSEALDIVYMWTWQWLSDNDSLWNTGMGKIGFTVGDGLSKLSDKFPNTLGKIKVSVGNGLAQIKQAFTGGMNDLGILAGTTLVNLQSRFSGSLGSIKSLFNKDKWNFSGIKAGLYTSFNNAITNLKNVFNTWFSGNPSQWFGSSKWSFSGIKDGLSKAFNSAIEALKKIWNAFATWINKALTLDFDGFSKTFSVLGKKIEVGLPAFEVSLGSLPTFATGGFPEDGLFMANHNELVGQFANGKTAVANNEQIIEGIKQGVYEAVVSAMSNTSSESNGDVIISIDGKHVFRAVRKQAQNYTRQTGSPAF